MTNRELQVVEMMEKYGGSFVKSLAAAFRHADVANFVKLKNAFPEIWADYVEILDQLEAKGQI